MKMKDRIEELEKRVRDLEARPVWYPVPYYVAPPIQFTPPSPWSPQYPLCPPPFTYTTYGPAMSGGQNLLT